VDDPHTVTRAGAGFLAPFSDLLEKFHHPPAYVLEQIGGNLLVLTGFGFLGPIRWRIHPQWIVEIAASSSAAAETLQWALRPGRVASVDDVLVNTVGALLAVVCARRWWPARVVSGEACAARVDEGVDAR
jgi:glycopeptide antibiotics resistance protein